MIARTALLAGALAELGLMEPRHARLVESHLLAAIQEHGTLTLSNSAQMSQLVQWVKTGPLDATRRKRWEDLLFLMSRLNRVVIREDDDSAELVSWRGTADIVIAESELMSTQFHRYDDPFLDPVQPSTEFSSIGSVPDSSVFAGLRLLKDTGHLAAGQTRAGFWTNVLGPLAAQARRIVLLDGYAFVPLLRRGNREPTDESALPWLIRQLDQKNDLPRDIEIISQRSEKLGVTSARAAQALLEDQLRLPAVGSVQSIAITLGEHWDVAHDRHLRFSSGGLITLGGGIDRVDFADVRDHDGLNWSYRTSANWHPFRDAEDRTKGSRTSDKVMFSPPR